LEEGVVKQRALILSLIALVLILAWGCGPTLTGLDDTPIDISRDPVQEKITDPHPVHFEKGGYDWIIKPLATYELSGLVLSRKNYRSGWNSILSPCDVAMAWGKLVENDLHRRLDWSQTGRWYWWEYGSDFHYDNSFVSRYSSNNHIIPATPNLARAARSLGRGDIAVLRGDLVRVDGRKGGDTVWWTSSTSRKDKGDGSCEVLYLKYLRVDGKVYE
jgi:hypothetical protein